MAVDFEQLTLDAAILTGGAVIEAAASGRPRCVTTAPDILRENGGYYNGVVFDVDNTHYWTSDFGTANTVVRRLISTGVVDLTVTISGAGPMGMQRWIDTDGTAYLMVGCYSLFKVARIRMSDGAYTLSAVLANRPVEVCKLPGSALDGPVWVLDSYNDTAVCREVDFATGAILRTIGAAQWGSIGSNVADRLVLANNAAVSLYDTAPTTPALLYTFNFTAPNLADGAPGSSINATATSTQACIPPKDVAVGPGNTIYVLLANGMVDLLDIVAGTFTRVRTMDPDRDGASLPHVVGYRWAPFLDFSPDGKWMSECVAEGVTAQSVKWHRFTRVDDAVATWTFSAPLVDETVEVISVPGCHGNSFGMASARKRSERVSLVWDDRRSSFSYSVDGGSTWVTFDPGMRLSIPCSAGTAPKLRAKLYPPSWLRPAAPRPWIAGSAGEGPVLTYDLLSSEPPDPEQPRNLSRSPIGQVDSREAAIVPDEYRKLGIEDVDRAVVNWFDKVVDVHVTSPTSDREKVKVILSSGERWLTAADRKGVRDKDGRLILPLIGVRRTGIEPQTKNLSLGTNTPRFSVSRKLASKSSELKNASTNRHPSNRVPDDTTVYEVASIPFPMTGEATYELVVQTQFISQMNEVIQKVMTKLEYFNVPQFVMPVDWSRTQPHGAERLDGVADDDPAFDERKQMDKYYYVGFFDPSFADGSNIEEFTDQERIVKFSAQFKVPIYLHMDEEGNKPALRVDRTAFKLDMGTERVTFVSDQADIEAVFGFGKKP